MLSSDSPLAGLISPAPSTADQGTCLNADTLFFRRQKSCVPAPPQGCTARGAAGTGQGPQPFAEEAGWGTCIEK